MPPVHFGTFIVTSQVRSLYGCLALSQLSPDRTGLPQHATQHSSGEPETPIARPCPRYSSPSHNATV